MDKNNRDEIEMMIKHIQLLHLNNDPKLSSINNVSMLYDALHDLDEVVGMYDIKKSIVQIIRFLFENSGENNKFDQHMLHSIIGGPPGVGKTTIGCILAKIWVALGLVKKKNKIDILTSLKKLDLPIIPSKIEPPNNTPISQEPPQIKRRFTPPYVPSKINYVIKYIRSPQYTRTKLTVPQLRNSRKYQEEDLIADYKPKIYNTEKKETFNKVCGCYASSYCIHDLEKKYLELQQLVEKEIEERKNKIINHVSANLILKRNLVNPVIKKLERTKHNAPIQIAGRADLVGQYIGHTCDKTQKLLSSTLDEGKVLFLDEAYSLVIDEKDSFGHEALNELNRFMSEHPDLVIIFAGYKDKLENTLFKYQPGFKRRCIWIFDINTYTSDMLSSIFKKQLNKYGWIYKGTDEKLNKFFEKHKDNFKACGGDTLRLGLYCKLKHSDLRFYDSDNYESKIITFDILKKAYNDIYLKNNSYEEKDNISTNMMYL